MVLYVVLALKLALVAAIATGLANSRFVREARDARAAARRPDPAAEGAADPQSPVAPSPVLGWAKAAGLVMLAEAALFALVVLP